MSVFLGLDTSNYTTSAALFDSASFTVKQTRKLLPVKEGERGLRQSDAVFHHTAVLPGLLEELLDDSAPPDAVGVSFAPERREGSYMPCFLVGEGLGRAIAAAKKISLHRFSHQEGHIAAALFSAEKLDWVGTKFFAFHVSGGTTRLLLTDSAENTPFTVSPLASSLDLKAGQAIDRLAVRLGYRFPGGKQLDLLSQESTGDWFIGVNVPLKDGSCSLSGLENKANQMLARGVSPCDTARFVFDSIAAALYAMYTHAALEYGTLPVLFAGGVMANTRIRSLLSRIPGSVFAQPEFSCDNAAGAAILAYLEEKE